MDILRILIVLEILISNMVLFTSCCGRKYSRSITVISIAVFTALYFAVFKIISPALTYEAFGSGLMAVMGWFYIIPLNLLYRDRFIRVAAVMCITWTYTYGSAVVIGQIFDIPHGDVKTYALATAVGALYFVVTLPVIKKLFLPKIIYILDNIYNFTDRGGIYLILAGMLYFASMFVLGMLFRSGENGFLNAAAVVLLETFICIFYVVIYEMVKGAMLIRKMEIDASRDSLTGVYNRNRLFSDMEDAIRNEEKFSIVFMDLDSFKGVNDKYGHMTGDEYLRHFSRINTWIFKEKGKVYRFGGDEFAVLCKSEYTDEEKMKREIDANWGDGAPCPFSGVSIGCIYCEPPHNSAEAILKQADSIMYQKKEKKKREALQ